MLDWSHLASRPSSLRSHRWIEPCEPRRLFTATAVAAADFTSYGATPYEGVVADAAGDLFGVTQTGGPAKAGTVYEIPAGTALPTTLYAFTGGATDGGSPGGPLVRDAAGDLFGLTHTGGAGGLGVLFELPAGASAVVPLADNASALGGYAMDDLVTDAAGDLFGCTDDANSAFAPAHVFEYAAAAGHPVSLTAFPNAGLGGLAVAANGDLYGFCSYLNPTSDGNISPGTIFRIAADGGRYDAVTTLATFPSILPVEPSAGPPVLDAAGDVFGVFAVNHELFELPAGTNTLEIASPFTHSTTTQDVGQLTVDSAGNVFGTTLEATGLFGGQFGGAVFEIPAGTDLSTLTTVDTVATVSVIAQAVPSGPLLVLPNGVLVGTVTPYLSLGTTGTVYEIGSDAAPAATTATALSSSAAVVDAGSAITFTATVAPVPAGGTVTFVATPAGAARVTLGSAAVAADGTATFSTTLTSATNAEQTFVAVYGGDAADAPSTSAAVTVGVVAAQTVTTLSVNDPISFGRGTVGKPLQLVATLAYANVLLPTQPTGTVTFYVGAKVLGTASVNGYYRTATLSTSDLPNGIGNVTAVYAGDPWYAPSTSNVFVTQLTGPGLVPSVVDDTLPAQVVSGATVNARVRIDLQNFTVGTVRGRTTVAIYLSTDLVLDAADPLITRMSKVMSIPALGASPYAYIVSIPIPSIPNRLARGTYRLLAEVTDPAGDANTTVLPDSLTVVAPLAALTATLTLAGPKTYLLSVVNDGTATVAGRMSIDVSLVAGTFQSATLTHVVTRPLTLRAGSVHTFRLLVVRPKNIPAGTYAPLVAVVVLPYGATATTDLQIAIPG